MEKIINRTVVPIFTLKKCPKCGYERTQKDDTFIAASECPKCGVIYEKEEAYIAQKKKQIEDERERQEAEEKGVLLAKMAKIEQIKKYQEELQSKANVVWQRVESGQEAYIYECIYIPVDSIIGEEQPAPLFNITILKHMGLMGWDIVSVVPRTIGIAYTNQTVAFANTGFKSWAGGMGGNVIGVHVILKKFLNSNNKDSLNQELMSFIESLQK